MKEEIENEVDLMSVNEAGRLGGRSTLSRYGRDHFQRIGIKGAQATQKRWSELMKEYGKRGGRPPRISLEVSNRAINFEKGDGRQQPNCPGSKGLENNLPTRAGCLTE